MCREVLSKHRIKSRQSKKGSEAAEGRVVVCWEVKIAYACT